MIYSDSRGQSEELHFIKEKQTKQNKKTCNHSTAEQERAENRIGEEEKMTNIQNKAAWRPPWTT